MRKYLSCDWDTRGSQAGMFPRSNDSFNVDVTRKMCTTRHNATGWIYLMLHSHMQCNVADSELES